MVCIRLNLFAFSMRRFLCKGTLIYCKTMIKAGYFEFF